VARLWQKVGVVLEMRLGDPRGALAAYLQVVAKAADVAAACAAVRVAAGLGEWDVAARAIVDLAGARQSAPGEVVSAFEHEAERSSSWDMAASALGRALSSQELRGDPARDLQARLAAWHRDRRGDHDAAEEALRLALDQDPANAELLSALADLQRRSPGRALVETLLRLSKATGGDLALLREAAEVAGGAVADPALARAILGDVLELARDRWIGEGSSQPEGGRESATAFAEWAVESLASLLEREGDAKAVADVLVDGAELPFDSAVRRLMRRRAARIALDRLSDHDRAIGLYLSLFDDDPHDAEAIERLAATYSALGRPGELLRLRERQIAAAVDATERLGLRLQAAKLYADLGDSAAAAGALRANLDEDSRHVQSVEALAAMFDGEGRARELGELLAAQAQLAQSAGDVQRAAGLWFRAAEVAEHRLSDPAAAEAHHARAVALEPRATSFDALARLAQGRGDPAAAAARLESLLEVIEPAGRVEVILRLAEALVAAGDPARAAERLESSLGIEVDAQPLRLRLADLYRAEGQWPKLARLVSDAAAHAGEPSARLGRLLEAAKLFTDYCSEPEQAIPLLQQATGLAPADQAIRLALAEALSQAHRFDEARAILKEMIGAFGGRRPKERAPVHYQMARLELATGHRAAALAEFDTATRIDPQNPEILRALAELARDDGQLERAEKSYRALLVVLRRRADRRETASIARSEVLLELSAIAQRDGETDRAREILESAIEAAAQDDFEQERLESQLRERGDDETLVRVLEAKLAHVGDSPVAAKTLGELAQVLTDRLGRPERALDVRLRALALEPRSAAAHEAALSLARSLGKVGRYVDGAVALVDATVEAGDAQLAYGLLARLGGVVESDLGDERRAAELYQRAVSLGSRSADVLRSLDRLYERLGDADNQAEVLALRVEAELLEGGPPAANDAVYRLAALRLGSRETFEAGVEMIEKALDLDPQPERAADLLRRAAAIDPTHARLLDLYERVGRLPGQERALVDALRLRTELPGSSVETVREGVDVATRLGDGALARAILERFVDAKRAAGPEVADLPWALAALANLHEAAGDLRKAVELKREAAEIADPDVARALKFEAARTAAEKLGDLALAAEAYEALYRADPADREAWEPLLAVYRKSGDGRKVVDLLGAVVDYVEDAPERARLRLERVRTMMEQKDLDDVDAAPLLREIVDEDGSQVEAALMLAAILERTGDREGLVDLLGRQIDAARDRSDASAVASLALRLGALLETTDRVEARNVYYTGLDWEPKSRELLDALLRLLQDDEDAAERADVLERRLAAEAGPAAEQMALVLHATRAEAGDIAGAERALELGFRAYPASSPLRQQLEDAYRERSDWGKLAELYVIDAGARVDRDERLSRLKQAAGLWRNELHDPRTAASVLRLAREVAPDDPSLLREHVDVLVEANDPASAAAELGAVLDRLAPGDGTRASILAMRASLRAAAHDAHGSLEDLEGAFELDRKAYAADLAAALGVAREAATSEADAEKVRDLRLREAQVLPYAGEVDAARAVLGELVRHNPKDREALSALAGLEASLDRWDAASAVLARLVLLEEGPAAVTASMRLAEACEHAGRPGDARSALERARAFAPEDRALRERLERAYEQSGAWHELATLALEEANSNTDPRARFAQFMRAGAVLLESAGDPQAAIGALEEARAILPADLDCVGLLSDAYTLWGRAEDALTMIDEVLAPHKGRRSRELAPLYWRLSRVYQHTEDAAAELRALTQALECDAQNGDVCSAVAVRAIETDELDLGNRALRAVTLLKVPGPMSKALAYQYMGEISVKQGDPKRALTLLKRALAEDPSLETARGLIEAMERGGA
jgi:tetratricopeptide (TPR) repeat protein